MLRTVAGKQQLPGGGQYTGRADAARVMVLPDGLARFVIDRPESAPVGSDATLHGTISFRVRICVREIENAEGLRCTHVKEARLGIEAGRRPVSCASRIWGNKGT